MILPTIHLNGTSAEMLLEGYLDANRAVLDAADVLRKIEFNARDYYPQGMEAWDKAVEEMRERHLKLKSVADELAMIANHIVEIQYEREARKAANAR